MILVTSHAAAGNAGQLGHDLLPALAQISECGDILRQYEAGMHKTQPCAAIDFGESPGDDCVETRAILRVAVMPALPRVGQALVVDHFEHLAMDHAVPSAGWRRLEGEACAFHRRKSHRLHQPAIDEFAARQRFPNRLRRVRKHVLDHDVYRTSLRPRSWIDLLQQCSEIGKDRINGQEWTQRETTGEYGQTSH